MTNWKIVTMIVERLRRGSGGERFHETIKDGLLDLRCIDPSDRTSIFSRALGQRPRDIVAVAHA